MEGYMAIYTTYTNARANFAKFLKKVVSDNEIVVINRRGAEPVALISAAELSSLTETAHLLRSPKNAERLLRALGRAKARTVPPAEVEDIYREIGLDQAR